MILPVHVASTMARSTVCILRFPMSPATPRRGVAGDENPRTHCVRPSLPPCLILLPCMHHHQPHASALFKSERSPCFELAFQLVRLQCHWWGSVLASTTSCSRYLSGAAAMITGRFSCLYVRSIVERISEYHEFSIPRRPFDKPCLAIALVFLDRPKQYTTCKTCNNCYSVQ